MNVKLKKVKQLQKTVLGIEMNLKLLEDDMDALNNNLLYLNKIEEDLIYNINLHRSNEVITIVNEYKKSIIELEMVRKEIIASRRKFNTVKARLNKTLDSYSFYMDELDKAFVDLNSEPVILLFKRDNDE